MNAYTPRGRYNWTVDLTAQIYGTADRTIIIAHDVDVELDISCTIGTGGDLEINCTDVLIDGVSLRNGDDTAKMIRLQVMEKADAEIENGGWLFEQVRDAEGLSLSGHPGDPDTCWQAAAE